MIVVPDNYWEEHSQNAQRPQYSQESFSRLAWVLDANAPGFGVHVWVDAENGTILGGWLWL